MHANGAEHKRLLGVQMELYPHGCLPSACRARMARRLGTPDLIHKNIGGILGEIIIFTKRSLTKGVIILKKMPL